MLFVYVFLSTAAAVPMVAAMGYLYAFVTVPYYVASGKYAALAAWLPRWYAPGDPAAGSEAFEAVVILCR